MSVNVKSDTYPILYKLTYHPAGYIGTKDQVGQLEGKDKYDFPMQPGDSVVFSLPEVAGTGGLWTAKSDNKELKVTDKGFVEEGNPKNQGGSGYHSFLVELSGMLPEATPVHFVLNRLGKAIAEKTINVQQVEAMR